MRLFNHLKDHHCEGRRFAHPGHGFGERHERRGGGRIGGPFGGPGRMARLLEHGDLKVLTLHLIHEKPRHGYEIIKAIEDLAGGAYAPSPGVVYPTLTLLEDLGLVTSTTEGTRKRFSITEAGIQALAEQQGEVTTILTRIAAAQSYEPTPALIRATENLKTALRLKLAGKAMAVETARRIADLLDEVARKIEEL
ncbi:MAG: hypothetical protein B7Z81_01705 [Acidocella sp. 20-61-6]|nr:MAG: hypothetical protein B7Z81_01705 [Acidocella sp. 20-61-6]